MRRESVIGGATDMLFLLKHMQVDSAWPRAGRPRAGVTTGIVLRTRASYYHGCSEACMPELSRIGIALDSELLERFDRSIGRRGYTNRSEAFRDLIRDRLVSEQTAIPNATVVGTVTLIYDHHAHGVTERLTGIQHQHHQLIVSTSHAHLDHDSCLEVLIVHGHSSQVERLADRLIGLKGVQHGRLVMTAPQHPLGPPEHKVHKHTK